MTYDIQSLDKIASGDVSVVVATEIIKATMRQQITEAKVQKVYSVFRAWVWKALSERRRDPELRQWHALLSQTSAYLEDEYACHAERMRVLHELVHESISVSVVYSHSQVEQRSHVKEILSYLCEQPRKTMKRQDLQEKLQLKDANLSRVLSMMTSSGLIERSSHGKSAVYSLTADGYLRARNLRVPVVISARMTNPAGLYSSSSFDGEIEPRYTVKVEENFRHYIKSSLQPRGKSDSPYAVSTNVIGGKL